jgi:hypothetical protein
MSEPTKLRHLPVVWLGAIIFIGIIAACVLTIVVAQRYVDEPVGDAGDALLHMPLQESAPSS